MYKYILYYSLRETPPAFRMFTVSGSLIYHCNCATVNIRPEVIAATPKAALDDSCVCVPTALVDKFINCAELKLRDESLYGRNRGAIQLATKSLHWV